jgi:hypothetical protein
MRLRIDLNVHRPPQSDSHRRAVWRFGLVLHKFFVLINVDM